MVVLHVQTEQCCLTAVQTNTSGRLPPTTWHKTAHYNKDYFIYLQTDSTFPWTTLEGQLSLGTDVGATWLPGPMLLCWPSQVSQAGCSRPSIGSWLRWGELGLGGPLGLELLDGVECLVESESGCQCKERQVRGR